jgi:CBS domain containing-hemolysin-like protein
MDIGLRLAAVVALVAMNGFFVAAEFALVTARKTRIEQLAASGNGAARSVLRALHDPNRFISACQLGITVASLALGWIGEGTVAGLLEPVLETIVPAGLAGVSSHAIAVPLSFVVITFLHITLGEQVPKMLALQAGERTAMLTVGPTNLIGLIFRPFITLLYLFTDLVLRVFGMRWEAETHQSYTAEDIKLIIQSSRIAGASAGEPERIVERALDFARLAAHHVMVPRTEVVGVPSDVTLDRLAETMQRHQHSRYPVYEGTVDNIVGVLSAKQLAAVLAAGAADAIPHISIDIRSNMSEPLFVPETMRVDKLLAQMKQHRTHLAVVVDEYGVTAGVVSLRDLMDRIAGEVRDEWETVEPTIQWLADGSAMVDGLALLTDIADEFGIPFGDADFDTLGGYIFGRLGRRPAVGDTVDVDGRRLTIEELDGLRVSRVRIGPGGAEQDQENESVHIAESAR